MISELLKSIEKDYPLVVQSDAFRELKRRFSKGDAVCSNSPDYDLILFCVREYYGLSQDEIMRKKRKRRVVFPRQVAMFLMAGEPKSFGRKKIPCRELGRYFSMNHATVLYACRTIRGLMSYDKELCRTIEVIKEQISGE